MEALRGKYLLWWRKRFDTIICISFGCCFHLCKREEKSQEKFFKCMEQWFIKDFFFFSFRIFFFTCETNLFSGNFFRRNYFSSMKLEFFKWSYLGENFFFLCVKPKKKCGFQEKKMFSCSLLCLPFVTYAVNSRTLFQSTRFHVHHYLYKKQWTFFFFTTIKWSGKVREKRQEFFSCVNIYIILHYYERK